MPKENLIPIENKKPFETVAEIKNEVPSFEEFMKTYESDERVNESYQNEISSYSNIGERKVSGPMYSVSSDSTAFSIKYRFNHSGNNRKNYFEQSGSYSNEWSISGSWDELYREQQKFEEGKIRVVFNERGSYEINKHKEEEVKDQLRKDVYKFRQGWCGSGDSIEREFEDIVMTCKIIEGSGTYACPTHYPKHAWNKN